MRENEPYIKLSTMIGSRFRKKRTIFYHIASKSGGRSLDVDIYNIFPKKDDDRCLWSLPSLTI